MSQFNNDNFDCIAVVSHGLELSKNKINASLSMVANNLNLQIPIICPAPIWNNLQDLPSEQDCIQILNRDPRVHDTTISEILTEVTNVCYSKGWRSLLLIARLEDQEICSQILFAHGLQCTIIEHIPTL